MRKMIWIGLLMLAPWCMMAQQNGGGDKYQRQRDFEDFKNRRASEFQAFKDSTNKAFARMMEQKWQDYQVFVGQRRPEKPEPAVLPVAPKDSTVREDIELPMNSVVPIQEEMPTEEKQENESLERAPENLQLYRNVDVDFYMEKMNFHIPKDYDNMVLGGVSEKAVAKFWADLSNGDLAPCLEQCRKQKREMHLNDWALYDMITSLATESFPEKYAEQTIFIVYLLNQLGLDAKVGRANNQLVVLLTAKTTLYAISYVRCNNETYYIFSRYPQRESDKSAINTYPTAFPIPTNALDMNIDDPIHFTRKPSAVTYRSDFWGETVPFQVNQNAIDFYNSYPQVDVAIYANAEMSDELRTWANRQIKPFLVDLDTNEAVNVLLYYVQTEFDYATDLQQFGYEKPFFCEENFYYAKNDCEDRSILFAYLVRNLVGLPIVLLDYPDHIATAVALQDDGELKGDYYMIDGRKYYVCDPTYIGANIGETMPQYRQVGANIIKLKQQIIK